MKLNEQEKEKAKQEDALRSNPDREDFYIVESKMNSDAHS